MMNEARLIATKRMGEEAESLEADGIINISYTTSSIINETSEVISYGTAVKFNKKSKTLILGFYFFYDKSFLFNIAYYI